MNYILKDPTTADSVAIYVEEVRRDEYVLNNFKPPGIPQNKDNLATVYTSLFIDLVNYLVKKFGPGSRRPEVEVPSSWNEFNDKFNIVLTSFGKHNIYGTRPKDFDNIRFYVIQTLIYSCLCCRADRESYAYQLDLAYKRYSNQLLANSLSAMKDTQMISRRKCYSRSADTQACLPLSASPYQLSMSYIHKFVTKHQYDLYGACWALLKKLKMSYQELYKKGNQPEEFVKDDDTSVPLMRGGIEGGCVAALIELTTVKRAVMHTVLPETIIVIDSDCTITDQLPYQNSSVSQRTADLAIASGKTVDLSVLPSIPDSAEEDSDGMPCPKRRKIVEVNLSEAPRNESRNVELPSNTDSLLLLPNITDFSDPNPGANVREWLERSNESSLSSKRPLNTPLDGEPSKRIRLDENSANDSLSVDCQSTGSGTIGDDQFFNETDMNSLSSKFLKNPSNFPRHTSSASRLSVFMKDRNAISLLDSDSINNGGPCLLQHMQDNLLLTACDVTCQLSVPSYANMPPPSSFSDRNDEPLSQAQLDDYLLPSNPREHTAVLRRHRRGIINCDISLTDVIEKWRALGHSEQILSLVEEIHSFIDSKGYAGASLSDIKDWRKCLDGGSCMVVVKEMEMEGLLLREGVGENTWLTLKHAYPWVVHTQWISREDKQGLRFQGMYSTKTTSKPAINEDSKVPGTNNSKAELENATPKENENKEVPNPQTENDNLINKDNADCPMQTLHNEATITETLISTNDSTNIPDVHQEELAQSVSENAVGRLRTRFMGSRTKSSSNDLKTCQDMERNALEKQNANKRQQITVSLRPWIRIHGSLNRRVLDRMLGTVLFKVLENPGISGTKVAEKLMPALQPVHVYDILAILCDLGCVQKTSSSSVSAEPSSLFSASNYESLVREAAGPEDSEEDIYYTPTVDCITRMSLFIGEKKYSHDFLARNKV